MMRAAVLMLVFLGALVTPSDLRGQENGEADVVVVKMLETSATSYAFSPEKITVEPGQTIRFVQEGQVPHNVEFKDTPDGSRLDGVRMGPFLVGKGETYEIRIDGRFSDGVYDYVCTPHEMMGMKGTIVVDELGSNRD